MQQTVRIRSRMAGHRVENAVGRFRWAIIVLCLAAPSCSLDGIRLGDSPVPTTRASWAAAGLTDSRAQFATRFCETYADDLVYGSDPRDCRSWLDGAGEVSVQPNPPTMAADLPATRDVFIVPGIFGECVAKWATPFSSDHDALIKQGYGIHVIPTKGRGSAEQNADIIQTILGQHADALDGAVVIAYSKGITDFMLAASRPAAAPWRDRLHALVSVAGTVNGSPVAGRAEELYRKLGSQIPFKTCDPADGGGIASLTYREAMKIRDAFMASAPLLRRYSIAAVSRPQDTQPLLRGFHRLLSGIDQRNDGQVLMEDALLPGAEVLAVADADHWSVALPFEDRPEIEVRLLHAVTPFPRGPLVRAVLAHVAPLAGQPIETSTHAKEAP